MVTQSIDPALRQALRSELIEAGHLIPSAQLGLYGFGAQFEAIVADICSSFRQRIPASMNPTQLSFPTVLGRDTIERTDYISSFPQLVGSLHVFAGDDTDHRQLLEARERGESWDGYLADSAMSMVPAACHNVYPTLTGTIETPQVFDVFGSCFRNEPSPDPMRMVCFRILELVFVGDEDAAVEHRETALNLFRDAMVSYGLEISVDIANDPFFGRAGRILSKGQRREALKFEILTHVYPDAQTAIASGNSHRTHFSEAFDIVLPDGSPAHTSCAGIGIERVAIALLRTHGMEVESWPAHVQAALGR